MVPEAPLEHWQGTLVAPEGTPFGFAEVTLDADGARTTRSYRPSCQLRLDDGRCVGLRLAPGAAVGWNEETVRGRWASFEQTPWAELFADVAPGPHVEVKLTIRGPVSGATVFIRGRGEHGDPTAGESGYREAPTRELALIIASEARPEPAAAARPAPADAVAPGPAPAEPAAPLAFPRLLRVAALLCGATAAYPLTLAARLPSTMQGTVACLVLALTSLAAAAWLAIEAERIPSARSPSLYDDLLPEFSGRGAPASWRQSPVVAWLGACGVIAMLPMAVFSGESLAASHFGALRDTYESGEPGVYVANSLLMLSAVTLACVSVALWGAWDSRRRSARLVGLLLAPESAPGALSAGAWVTLEGRVRTKRPGETAARCVQKGHRRAGEGEKLVIEPTEHSSPWTLKTDRGSFEVAQTGDHACWGSSFFERTGKRRAYGACAFTDKRSVPDGARVLLAGRLSSGAGGGLALVARGKESLVFYASSKPARPTLRRRVRLHRLLLVLAVGTAMVALTAAAAVFVLPVPGG